MVAPLVKVVTSTKGFNYIPYSYEGQAYLYKQHISTVYKNYYRQKPPYVHTEATWIVSRVIAGTQILTAAPGTSSDVNPLRTQVLNAARAKFTGKLGETSQIGSTITSERKQSLNTITSLATSILLAANAVRRGDLVKAAVHLGFYPPVKRQYLRTNKDKSFDWLDDTKAVYDERGNVINHRKRRRRVPTKRIIREVWVMPTGRQVVKSLANRWLWFSYGIKPLVSDTYNAASVFTREMPSVRIRGSTGERSSARYSGSSWGSPYNYMYDYEYRATVSAIVRVSDPNLWLANQLGLINPVQMFNEGIPFSFVIDWFSNLSDWIASMTDFVGLEISEPITSSRAVTKYTDYYGRHFLTGQREVYSVTAITLSRSIGIPPVKLRFAYERFSWQRGANAISLLVQALKSR